MYIKCKLCLFLNQPCEQYHCLLPSFTIAIMYL